MEQIEFTHETDNKTSSHRVPGCIRLELAIEREILPIDIMCFETSVKPDIGQADAEPSHETRDGGHVGEPTKDLACTGGYSHECE